MAEQLRLEATVVDRFSKPLQDLRAKLANIKSPDGVRGVGRDFDAARGHMSRLAQTIDQSVSSSLVGLGARLGGVAGAVYAVGRAVSNFASEVPRLQSVARETGVSLNNLRALSAVARQVNIDAGDVERGVKTLSENITDMVRRRGNVWVELLKVAPNLAEQLRAAGVEKDMDKALDIALDAIMQIRRQKGAVDAKRYSELLFGVDLSRFGEMTRDELKAALAKAFEALALTPEQAKNAGALKRAFDQISDSLLGLGDTIAGRLAPGMKDVVDGAEALVRKSGPLREVFTYPLEAAATAVEALGRLLKGDVWGTLDKLLKLAPLTNFLVESARKSATPQEQLGSARERLKAMDEWLRANPGAEGTPFGRDVKRKRVETEDEIRRLEKAIKEGAAEGAREGVEKGLQGGAQRSGFQLAALGGGDMLGGFGGGSIGRGGGNWGWAPAPRGGGGGGGGGDGAGVPVTGSGTGAQLNDLITNAARKAGIDPRIMHGIRAGESLKRPGWYDRKHDALESSWGPFQLNRRRGLGVEFERDTADIRKKLGLGDLRDRRTIALQAEWVANYIANKGPRALRHWMGYRGPVNPSPRWGDSGYDPDALPEARRRAGLDRSNYSPAWPDDWRPGAAARAARDAGAFGAGQTTAPSGTAKLDVTLNGFPSGWRARAEGGGLFREVEVNRGRALVTASEE